MVLRLGLLAVWVAVALAPAGAAMPHGDGHDAPVVERDLGHPTTEAVESARIVLQVAPSEWRRPMAAPFAAAHDLRADASWSVGAIGAVRGANEVAPLEARRGTVLRL